MIEHLATRGIFWLVAKRGLLELLYIFILHPSPCLVIQFELAKYIYIYIYIILVAETCTNAKFIAYVLLPTKK